MDMPDRDPRRTAVFRVLDELDRATAKFAPFHSAHEGYAVIAEEFDEFWDEIKKNNTERAREECVQVAAMSIRFLIDIQPREKQ